MQEITGNEAAEKNSGEMTQTTFGADESGAGQNPLSEDAQKALLPGETGAVPEEDPDTAAQIAALEEENASLKDSFEPLYTKIGQNFYEKPQGYELAIAAAVEKLAGMDSQIHANDLQILRLKGIRYCPGCERIVDDAAVFCGDCGTRIDPVEAVDSGSVLCMCCKAKNDLKNQFCVKCGQRLVKADRHKIRCPGCGTPLPADARFCEECGMKVVPAGDFGV